MIKMVHSERSKVFYYQPKINNFKDNKSTAKLNDQSSPRTIHVYMLAGKVNTVTFYKGVYGATPKKHKKLKKAIQNGGFSFIFFFTLWQGSLNPQNYELAPQLP